ncbi:MAG: hypothetical protein HFE28_03460 [Clostridia bacterium]|nr:hypothetical protein [Clostridia bacterium]
MSKKRELKKAIEECSQEIEMLELKRMRSQSALLDAILEKEEPLEVDREYYRVYSALIRQEREKLFALREELAKLD